MKLKSVIGRTCGLSVNEIACNLQMDLCSSSSVCIMSVLHQKGGSDQYTLVRVYSSNRKGVVLY